ncbi:hypothetical protein EPIB2_830 [Tritonibacter mobilis]|nr:hypothetical protein SCH4B_0408 [Ruegeria sp. TrichCH4B]VCU61753.1 hypothetical protein EPIB2_830 [Tritonibacter mobilis]
MPFLHVLSPIGLRCPCARAAFRVVDWTLQSLKRVERGLRREF